MVDIFFYIDRLIKYIMDFYASTWNYPPTASSGSLTLDHFSSWIASNTVNDEATSLIAVISGLLLPLVIFFLDKEGAYQFDKAILLDRVLCAKWLISCILITSCLFIFSLPILSYLSLAILIVITTKVLVHSYNWLKDDESTTKVTYRQQMRLNYLDSLEKEGDIIKTWTSILENDKLSQKNQKGFAERYVKILRDTDYTTGTNMKISLHMLLLRNLDKINFSDGDTLQAIASYSLYYFTGKQHLNKSIQTDRQALVLLQRLITMSTQDRYIKQGFDYLFFKEVKEHLCTVSSPSKFTKEFIILYINIVKNDDTVRLDTLWDYGDIWTVTQESIEDNKKKDISSGILEGYRQAIISFFPSEIDKESRSTKSMIEVTGLIFPRIELTPWFKLIVFYQSIDWIDRGDGCGDIDAKIENYAKGKNNLDSLTILRSVNRDKDNEDRSEEEAIFLLRKMISPLRNYNNVLLIINKISDEIRTLETITSEDDQNNSTLAVHKARLKDLKNYMMTAKNLIDSDDKSAN